MTIDELRDAGCFVMIVSTAHLQDRTDKRWLCSLGHYLSPRWPSVDGYGDTIEEAIREATTLVLAAHKPDAAESACIYVPV